MACRLGCPCVQWGDSGPAESLCKARQARGVSEADVVGGGVRRPPASGVGRRRGAPSWNSCLTLPRNSHRILNHRGGLAATSALEGVTLLELLLMHPRSGVVQTR